MPGNFGSAGDAGVGVNIPGLNEFWKNTVQNYGGTVYQDPNAWFMNATQAQKFLDPNDWLGTLFGASGAAILGGATGAFDSFLNPSTAATGGSTAGMTGSVVEANMPTTVLGEAATSTGGGAVDWLDALGEAIAGGGDVTSAASGIGTGAADMGLANELAGLGGTGSTVVPSVGGGLGGTLANLMKFLASPAGKIASMVLGGVLGGTQGQAGPISSSSAPWNASYFGPLQDATLGTMATNQLNLPAVPTLPGLPDIANTNSVNAAIQAAIAPMRQNFFDPGGTLSRVRTEFGDQYGSTKHQQATGLATGREAAAEGNVGASMMNALYPVNLQYNKDRATQEILNNMWKFGQESNQATQNFSAPWTNLTNAANIFGTAAGRGTTQTTQLPSTPWWQSAAGGALTAAQLWNLINGSGTSTTPGR